MGLKMLIEETQYSDTSPKFSIEDRKI